MEPTQTLTDYLADVDAILRRYLQLFPNEAERLTVLARQLQERSYELCTRSGLPGHLTGSALVWRAADDSVLLIRHNFLKRWLQPGGHMDEGEHPVQGALRELNEEVGVLNVQLHEWQASQGVPIDIDSHQIPANADKNEPEHLHHDFQYLFVLQEEQEISLQVEEVSGFKWVSVGELLAGGFGNRLARTADKMAKFDPV